MNTHHKPYIRLILDMEFSYNWHSECLLSHFDVHSVPIDREKEREKETSKPIFKLVDIIARPVYRSHPPKPYFLILLAFLYRILWPCAHGFDVQPFHQHSYFSSTILKRRAYSERKIQVFFSHSFLLLLLLCEWFVSSFVSFFSLCNSYAKPSE